MSLAPPPYYFRLRENGAAVFRVSDENRNARLEMTQIAVVNLRTGEVKPRGGEALRPEDEAAITGWLDTQRRRMAAREAARAEDLAEAINAAAHWAQKTATAAEIEACAGDLMMAMHDLRAVLLRRLGERG